MRNATTVTISTFGALAGLAGIEHGIGEILQGNRAPAGIMIVSWPESELFRIVGGEPAMTIVPNLLVTGILAILVSLVFLVWVTMFVQLMIGASVAGLVFGSAGLYGVAPRLVQVSCGGDGANLVVGLPILLGSMWLARRGALIGCSCGRTRSSLCCTPTRATSSARRSTRCSCLTSPS